MKIKIQLQKGFSLIELIIVIVIIAISSAIGIPLYKDFIADNCLTASTNSLVNSLQYSRSEAAKLNTPVRIDADAGGWGDGWSIVNDSTDELLKVIDTSCSAVTIDETGGDVSFTYDSDGFIDSAGTLNVCDDRAGETGRQIKISSTGRPSMKKNACL